MRNVYLYIAMFIGLCGYSQNVCSTNGGFETPLTTLPNPYSFTTNTGIFLNGYTLQQCAINTSTINNNFTAFGAVPLNNFGSQVTLVSPAVEPTLNTLGITTVSTVNSGQRAIKLNVSPNPTGVDGGQTNITTMSKGFVVSSASVDFRFSLIVKDGGHAPAQQPFFTARLYDSGNNLINTNQVCIQTNPANCIFQRVNTVFDPILYTGWQCARINIPPAYMGQNVRLEFVIADCGQTAHNGTVYIDDICTTNCSTPVFGSIQLDPVNQLCPSSSFTVCGNYLAPPNSTYNSMSLDVIQNGSVVGTITAPSSLTSSTFCFTVNPGIFGLNPSGDYEFEVNAIFNINCSPTPYPLIIFDTTDGVSFENCCVPDLVITTTVSSPDNREASNSITASNTLLSTQIGVYHAKNTVVFINGFHSASGSILRGYIEDCSGTFAGRRSSDDNNYMLQEEHRHKEVIEATTGRALFTMYPNPAHDRMTVSAEAGITTVTISSIEGMLMYSTKLSGKETSQDVDVSLYRKGIYIVNITTADGKTESQKLVKD